MKVVDVVARVLSTPLEEPFAFSHSLPPDSTINGKATFSAIG